MAWVTSGAVLLLLAAVCYVRVLIHAFSRSVGTGLMVLGIPCYVLFYAFSQFESPRKGWWIFGMLGLGGCGVFFQAAGLSLIRAAGM